MKILAIDLGKFKSVACDFDTSTGEHTFVTVATRPAVFHDLLAEASPGRLVVEVGSAAGWVKDLAEALEIDIQVDNPRRFKNAKQVGAYAGLVPKQYESGTMSRQGRITGQGNKLLRSLLVEVSWLMRQHNPYLRTVFDRVCGGSKTRRKVAVVATARKLLIICWAMLRDGACWREPTLA